MSRTCLDTRTGEWQSVRTFRRNVPQIACMWAGAHFQGARALTVGIGGMMMMTGRRVWERRRYVAVQPASETGGDASNTQRSDSA